MSSLTRVIVVCLSAALIVLFLVDIDYQNFLSKTNRTELVGIVLMIVCIISMVIRKKPDVKGEF